MKIRGQEIDLSLQHSYLELRYVRIQRSRLERLRDRITCFDRIDDFVDPQPGRAIPRIGLLVVGTFRCLVKLFPFLFT